MSVTYEDLMSRHSEPIFLYSCNCGSKFTSDLTAYNHIIQGHRIYENKPDANTTYIILYRKRIPTKDPRNRMYYVDPVIGIYRFFQSGENRITGEKLFNLTDDKGHLQEVYYDDIIVIYNFDKEYRRYILNDTTSTIPLSHDMVNQIISTAYGFKKKTKKKNNQKC